MTWFKVDDGFSLHPKSRAAGKDGRALWYVAGEGCAREDLDGVVQAHMLPMYASLAEVDPKRSSLALVRAGLWHPHNKLCAACDDAREWVRVRLEVDGRDLPPLGKGDFYFHDWTVYQLDKEGKNDPIERRRSRRRKQLANTEKGKAIVAMVRQRDQDRCRYCGVLTVWSVGRGGDTRSTVAGTIDHVDPFNWVNSTANCVVACRTCNGRKKDRTPEEWVTAEPGQGRLLLPEPAPYQRTEPEPDPDQSRGFGSGDGNQPSDQCRASRDTRDGPGFGPGLGPDPEPALVGSAAGGAGDGR